jgi:hypothetical protein
MDVLSATGVFLGSVTRTARPNETILLTDIITSFLGLGTTSNFRVDFTLTSATGRVVPFATLVDDATGDGLFAPAVDPSSSAQDVIVAQASHATGANNDFFRTNLHVTNLGSAAVSITVSLIPRVLTGTPNPPRVYTLAPGQTIEKLDVLASEFGLADPSAAGLRIHPSGPARLRVSTRTFVEKFGGTFGFFIPGLTVSEAIGAGEGRVTAIQLDQTSAADGYRSNFGFAEVAGAGATVRVTVRDGADGALLGAKSYALGGHASFQASLNDILTSGAPVSNIYLQFAVESGAGRVLAYGVAVDNTSGDAIYIPAQREP